MDTFFDIEAQKRSRLTKRGAQTQHRVVLRLVPPSASKQSEIMCARDKCGVFHNIGKAISGSTGEQKKKYGSIPPTPCTAPSEKKKNATLLQPPRIVRGKEYPPFHNTPYRSGQNR